MHEPVADYFQSPDVNRHFYQFGEFIVAEILLGPLKVLREAYEKYAINPGLIAILGRMRTIVDANNRSVA